MTTVGKICVLFLRGGHKQYTMNTFAAAVNTMLMVLKKKKKSYREKPSRVKRRGHARKGWLLFYMGGQGGLSDTLSFGQSTEGGGECLVPKDRVSQN